MQTPAQRSRMPMPPARFARSFDGTRIAYACSGRGPAVVRVPTWMGHLEHEWDSPILRHWIAELGQGHTLLRFNMRGCGLSEWSIDDFSFEACVRDMEAVVDAAGLDRFAICANSAGTAMAIAYAARHPERVSRMLFFGAFCRGRLARDPSPESAARADLLLKLIESGWGTEEPAFRQVFTALFIPGGTPQEWSWLTQSMRLASSPHNASRLSHAIQRIDVQQEASRVRCPTLLLHSRRDSVVAYDEGQHTARLIPGSEFITIESANHIILEHEPAWQAVVQHLRRFLGAPGDALQSLTRRELEVLEQIALGKTNDEIAGNLRLSPKTIRNVTTAIYAKLGVSNRAQAVVKALEAGALADRAAERPLRA